MSRVTRRCGTAAVLAMATTAVFLAWPAGASVQNVTITQHLVGDFCTAIEPGETWIATGAIADSGTVSGSPLIGRVHERVLAGAQGTIRAAFVFTSLEITETGFTATERWWIRSGTGSYAGLHGQGSGRGSATFSGDPTCPDVAGTDVWTGSVAR